MHWIVMKYIYHIAVITVINILNCSLNITLTTSLDDDLNEFQLNSFQAVL